MKLNSKIAILTGLSKVFKLFAVMIGILTMPGCSLFPETRFRENLHNPFPQIKRVAVLPFYNQSGDPSINGDSVAEAYYTELQSVPGFEVLPVGVTKAQWFQFASVYGEPQDGAAFQRLAKFLGVEAVVVGSVTEFEMYYPPRLAMTVHWYAANEGFHPIPAGYGLPWGTEAEKEIPRRIVREAEFELARSQLATQTPLEPMPPQDKQAIIPGKATHGTLAVSKVSKSGSQTTESRNGGPIFRQVGTEEPIDSSQSTALVGTQHSGSQHLASEHMDPFTGESTSNVLRDESTLGDLTGDVEYAGQFMAAEIAIEEMEAPMPTDWPDPTDLIPDPPSPERAIATINHDPVLSHTRIFRGDDPYLTKRLADRVETGDDARPGGWQGYLKRSDDFIRFCCHLHMAEMLESRGGSDQSDLILRWPLSRY